MMVALLVEELLLCAGCEVVGPAATVAEALKLVASERLDGAVLDINLGGDRVYPVADALRARGVPFLFVSGYGPSGVAAPYAGVATIQKPFNPATFDRDVAMALSKRRAA